MSVMKESATQQLINQIKSALAVGKIATIDSELSSTSENPVQNKVITEALENYEVENVGYSQQSGVSNFSVDFDISRVVEKCSDVAYNYIGIKLYVREGATFYEKMIIADINTTSNTISIESTDIGDTGSAIGEPYNANVSWVVYLGKPKMRITASLYRQSSVVFSPQVFATQVFFVNGGSRSV